MEVIENVDGLTGVLYEVTDDDVSIYSGYMEISIEDYYDDNNNGYIYGLNIGEFERVSEDLAWVEGDVSPQWFKTTKDRDAYKEEVRKTFEDLAWEEEEEEESDEKERYEDSSYADQDYEAYKEDMRGCND